VNELLAIGRSGPDAVNQAGAHRPGEAKRVTHGDDKLSNPDTPGVTEPRCIDRTRRFGAQYGEVAPEIATIQACGQGTPVPEFQCESLTEVGNNMSIRHDRAGTVPNHPGAGGASPAPDLDRRTAEFFTDLAYAHQLLRSPTRTLMLARSPPRIITTGNSLPIDPISAV
jgi:hypothetical protein